VSSPHEVRRATPADADDVAGTLAAGFLDDPVMGWLLPPGIHHREDRLRRLFECEVHSFFGADKSVYLSGDRQSAALWAPPGTWRMTAAESRGELLSMIGIFRAGLPRASRLAKQLDAVHPGPTHWYLYMLGTRPDAQGRGIGSAMLREGLRAVDADGSAAYLESSNFRNVALYERHGFAVVDELRIARGGPMMWRMWRDPAG
jgi:ribosomal protein S18 acetylase RimI-like enzyme